MKKIKQGIFIVSFFGLLVCIAAAPTFVTRYYNGRLLNAVTLRELPPEESQAAVSIRDKLEIVERAKEDGTFYMDDYVRFIESDTLDAERRKLLFETLPMLQEQLDRLLESMGIVIEDMEELESTKTVYVDRERRGMPVGIWHVRAETPDYYFIDAFMDAETGMLYDISLFSENITFSKQASEHFREAGREYMKLDAETNPDGGWLDVGVDFDYDGRWLRLYIYGTKDGGEDSLVTYAFSDNWTNTVMDMDAPAMELYRVKPVTDASMAEYWE